MSRNTEYCVCFGLKPSQRFGDYLQVEFEEGVGD